MRVAGHQYLKVITIPFILRSKIQDVVSHDPNSVLLPDSGVRHEIDLVPGTKHCVELQWTFANEQCDVIDDFFRAKHEAGMVSEVNFHIQYRHFASKSRTTSGTL